MRFVGVFEEDVETRSVSVRLNTTADNYFYCGEGCNEQLGNDELSHEDDSTSKHWNRKYESGE